MCIAAREIPEAELNGTKVFGKKSGHVDYTSEGCRKIKRKEENAVPFVHSHSSPKPKVLFGFGQEVGY